MNVCCIIDVQDALWRIISAGRQDLEAAIRIEDASLRMGHILDYYTVNVEKDMMPCVMMQAASEEFKWFSLPTTADSVPMIEVWAVVHHDDERIKQRTLARLGGAIASVVNRRHLPIEVPGGWSIYFNERVPIARTQYGVARFSNALVGACIATFACDVTVCLPDTADPTASQIYP